MNIARAGWPLRKPTRRAARVLFGVTVRGELEADPVSSLRPSEGAPSRASLGSIEPDRPAMALGIQVQQARATLAVGKFGSGSPPACLPVLCNIGLDMPARASSLMAAALGRGAHVSRSARGLASRHERQVARSVPARRAVRKAAQLTATRR